MAVGDVYKLTIRGVQGFEVRMNSLAVRMIAEEAPTPAQAQTLGNDFKTIFLNEQHNSAVWQTWELRQLWGPTMEIITAECRREGGIVLTGALTAPLTGPVGASDALPYQSALVFTLGSGFAGRRRRGRWYGWGYPEMSQSASIWDATFITAHQTRANTFLTEYGPGGTDPTFQLGVWSEREASGCEYIAATGALTNIDTPSPATAFTPVDSIVVKNRVQTQRRRVPGVGF